MMRGTIVSLRECPPLPRAPLGEQPAKPLDLVVPYSNPSLAARALSRAAELANGFEAVVTLVAVHVLPYPAPLECQEGIRDRLASDLAAVARTSPVQIRVQLVFARDREQAYLDLLGSQSLVVIGSKDRWWRTGEERFARKLAAHGHRVMVVKVK